MSAHSGRIAAHAATAARPAETAGTAVSAAVPAHSLERMPTSAPTSALTPASAPAPLPTLTPVPDSAPVLNSAPVLDSAPAPTPAPAPVTASTSEPAPSAREVHALVDGPVQPHREASASTAVPTRSIPAGPVVGYRTWDQQQAEIPGGGSQLWSMSADEGVSSSRLGAVALIVGVILVIGAAGFSFYNGHLAVDIVRAHPALFRGGVHPTTASGAAAELTALGLTAIAQVAFCGILGLWAFVQGIVAIATKRGRAAGTVALLLALVAPVVAFVVFQLSAALPLL